MGNQPSYSEYGHYDDNFCYLYCRRGCYGRPCTSINYDPNFFPVAKQLGYDPIWFGVTITVITTLGAVTPPVGATTYVVGGMAKDVPLEDVFKGVTFFLPAYVFCVLILMILPKIVTFLPSLMH